MKREKYMDMAISAFREYALLRSEPERARITRADEEAVMIALSGADDDIEEAVRAVYMYAPGESITSSKIAARVKRYAFERHWSEESVWRRLRIARRAYALARGLIE
ncbi:MAG: hypothetical protein IJ381_08425 [Clostridia bacterium]|nr:hypothetical protein [Clostridia bacterium]